MASSMKMTRVFIVCLFCMVALAAEGQKTDTKKWHFHANSGEMEVWVNFVPGKLGKPVATLEMSADSGVTIAEESGFLRTVLEDLEKQGTSTRTLTMISFRLNEREAQVRLAEYAAKSHIWRSSLRTKSVARVYPLVVSFLNASGAYREWSNAFIKYDLGLKVVGVEEVGMEKFSKLGAKCPSGANCDNLLVPSDALVQINIVPKGHRQ